MRHGDVKAIDVQVLHALDKPAQLPFFHNLVDADRIHVGIGEHGVMEHCRCRKAQRIANLEIDLRVAVRSKYHMSFPPPFILL